MKIAIPWSDQARSGGENAAGYASLDQDSIAAQIAASYHTEHTVDDKHATIHASGSVSERNRTTAMGVWLTAPFSASYFSATAGSTWTVSQAQAIAFQYTLVGSTMTVAFYIESSTIGTATAATLYITIPGNYHAIRRTANAFTYDDNGTRGTGIVQVRPQSSAPNSGISLELTKDLRASSNFSISSAMTVIGEISFEIYQFDTIIPASSTFSASGGTITVVGTKTIHTFTGSGTFTVAQGSAPVDYLVVAGGGGGTQYGGGGSGRLLTGTDVLVPGGYTITVGGGGTGRASGTNGDTGSDSVFNGHTAAGGGGGGNWDGAAGHVGSNGGSGGGGAGNAGGGAGTSPGGHNGGLAVTDGATYNTGGGGGGATAVGGDATAFVSAGDGGAGTASSISGSSVTYAGGGGGGAANVSAGNGGSGGGGAGSNTVGGANGTTNRGGGGGGAGAGATGGNGGSGIIILSYSTP